MKTKELLKIALSVPLVFAASGCDSDEEKVQWSAVPEVVQSTITKHADGGKVDEIEKETKTKDGKPITVYEAEVKNPDGNELEIKVSQDGKLIELKNN